MGKLIVGVNDLATTRPELARQWHPSKNGELKPSDVCTGSNKKVWWLYPYDDPKTDKHFDFEWETSIQNRTNKKAKECPYLSGKAIWVGFNDLASTHPELAKQWHPTKNNSLKPTDVSAGSEKKVWWLYPYDDPKTGKHFDFEWETYVFIRAEGSNCPFISGQAVWIGFNDLATTHPEIAAQWHPTKNGDLKPTDISAGNKKNIWWLLPYDDPITGKHFDFEWLATPNGRTKGNGCPYLSGRAVWVGFNDLATVHPQIVKEWHPTKNGDLKPTDVTAGSNKKVWWFLSYNDPETGKQFNLEWLARINGRVNRNENCPFLSGKAVLVGFNDLATTHPELAKQWHPTKNGNLTPKDVTTNSEKKIWWLLPYDDPITGKHFDFVWESRIANRTNGNGCPYLSGNMVWVGFNDLASNYPELAMEWHPTKNGDLKPTDITKCSKREVWWYKSYDDPSTGKHFDFEWKATIANRVTQKLGCPFLSGKAVWTGFNDLETIYPELAKQWHPTKNGNLKPTNVSCGSAKNVWWFLPYDDPKTGKHFDFEWKATPTERAKGNGCPYLSGKAVWVGFNDLATVNPDLAKEWHPTKNGNLKPTDVTACSGKKVWWKILYTDLDTGEISEYEWESKINNRKNGSGCPYIDKWKTQAFIHKILIENNILTNELPRCRTAGFLLSTVYNKALQHTGFRLHDDRRNTTPLSFYFS